MAVLSSGLLGVDACFYPILDLEVQPITIIDDPDSRCVPLSGSAPPDLAFEPSSAFAAERVWVAESSPSRLWPFTVEMAPPTLADAIGTFSLPADSDLDGFADASMLEGISFLLNPFGISGLLDRVALLTATGHDEVLLFDASVSQLVQFQVSVPVSLSVPFFPLLPDPGVPAVTRTGLSTVACLAPGTPDSQGNPIVSIDAECPDSGFFSSSTSGAAIAGALPNPHLFVSVGNPGSGAGSADPQFLPGAVLVYALDFSAGIAVEPDPAVPVIFTSGFNPTQVTAYSAAGRNFILVTVSGAIGTVQDLISTPEVEGGFTAETEAYIDVIDADTLQLVATIPLGFAGPTGRLAVRPNGIGAVGSMLDRWVLAVDLAPLADPTLPNTGPPVVLDASSAFGNAVIRDASNPYVIPDRTDGAAEITCRGLVAGVAFNASGTILYATDFCDGTMSVIGVGSSPPTLFSDPQVVNLTAPIDTLDTAAPRGLGAVAVRPGVPSVAFTGPDVFVLVGEPSGLLCAVAVESGS